MATYNYQWEIYEQLERYGFQQKEDYIHCNNVVINYESLLEQVCFAEKQYPYNCNRTFGHADVASNGDVYLCCPYLLPISAGNMKTETFINCWNSYVAHIVRLSVCNGTFVFCDKKYCDLLEFERMPESQQSMDYNYNKMEVRYPNTLTIGIDYSCNLKCPC